MTEKEHLSKETEEVKSLNFIEEFVEDDIKNQKHAGRIHTRFPPEPNGYLHIGHAKSICLNFGLALKYNGLCNLRFDDTNPVVEDVEYVDSIREDVRWLGFDWGDREFYASDYFDQIYEFAIKLIKDGKAFVCEMSGEEVSATRGTPNQAGNESPYRNRTVAENLDLFERMKNGEFADGTKTLRAKTGMDSPNMQMRDPVMYRIKHAHHHRTGDKWCIYPMYDFAHGQSDSIEGITHSICTLEFENHRPLYNWYIQELGIFPSRQIEFARLNITFTVMSKRKLLQLVKENYVNGWDDPRMPTICGMRRRGYTALALRNFADRIGVAKRENIIDISLLEFFVREDLNKITQRLMAVMNPLKMVITNYPEGKSEDLDATNNPEDETMGKHNVPFSRELFIEQDDFMEDAPKNYFRLTVGQEVRLRYAYFVKCTNIVKDETGKITEIHCTYDPESKGGKSPDGRKVKGTIHWVSAQHAVKAETRLYDRLFSVENPDDVPEGGDFKDNMNPNSLTISECFVEPFAKTFKAMDKFQFERIGYFCLDKDATTEKLIFNKTVGLKDTWAKVVGK
ncbi:MAG TPA: glutamine--tRNA ligase [Bacteroidales bacterium]|nr:MAG: glutamine--tRNA ligase [Bacteroidetes bacterium GWF2_33_38]OFY76081.1 MAG: glutamine--tRNA ligase [Bacteroidetes bacterium RIFOXYA12_FULL_33_9]HBF88891.1 glutamine--tRNA ligase [Bacteroidales bacterium]